MTTELPTDVAHYATSGFTDKTLPAKLRADHSTKVGVWGQVVVTSGRLRFCRQDGADQVLDAGGTTVFAPQEVHSVTPDGPVEFEVRFYRQEVSGHA